MHWTVRICVGLGVAALSYVETGALAMDADVAAELSGNIARWQAMGAGQELPPAAPSAPGAQQPSDPAAHRGTGVSAFDDQWEYEQRNYELQRGIDMSQDKMRELSRDAQHSAIQSVGKTLIKPHLSTGIPRIDVPIKAATTGYSAYGTWDRTLKYGGRSMQIMNPPVYLDTKTATGWVGTTKPYRLSNGGIGVTSEVLSVGSAPWNRSSDITRWRVDQMTMPGGTFYRQQVQTLPDANWAERLMLKSYPVGSYYDPARSTYQIRQSYRSTTTRQGTMYPLGSSR